MPEYQLLLDQLLNIVPEFPALLRSHRHALEEVIGCELASQQRLIISVIEVKMPVTDDAQPPQTPDDWTSVYDGLSDCEIDQIASCIAGANHFEDCER